MDIGKVRPIDINVEMRRSYLDYAMSVIVQRALPDVRDGLKPVQRRILYGMSDMGLRSNTRFRKSAGIVGEVLKSYHPHSDTAVYDALVRMVQDFSLRYPLVAGQGNFGSVDGDSAAAMRYTESKLSAIAEELLQDIGMNTVDFEPNYDGQTTQPTVLPGKLPNLLVNGASGIAVGMATNIPPHNLGEICDGVAHLIDEPDATVEDLMQFIHGPDFPTGATILGREGIVAAYATGRGRVVMRANAFIEESARANRYAIIVNELPYQVNKATLIEKIADLVKNGKLDGIHDLRDESDRNGMRMVIELKREAQPRKVLNNLYKFTALQSSFGVNMLALVDGKQPRVLNLKRALQAYIEHRQTVITRRTQFELQRAQRRAHVLEGVKIALDNLDAVIRTIRASRTSESARANLMRDFKLTEIQATAILDMQLRRLAALERRKIEDEYRELLMEINRLEDLLANPRKILALVRQDVVDLKEKYGDPRRSRIIDYSGELSDEDLIPEVDVLVTLTNRGYVKRIPDDVYRTQHRGGRGVTGVTMREADGVQHLLAANSHDSLLFFTNRGRVFQVKVYDLPDAGRTAKGVPVINLISIQPDESITTMLPIRSFDEGKYLFMCTRKGTVKRTALSNFASVRSSGLIALGLDDDDELAWVRMTSGEDEIILVTEQAKAIRFHESDARPMGRTAQGVRGIRLSGNDRVMAADVIDRDTLDSDLLIVSETGYGKRTALKGFNDQHRGGKGVTAMKLSSRNGKVAGAQIVQPDQEVMLISSSGVVIRTRIAQISRYGRQAQGVTLMRLGQGDRVVSLTVLSERSDEADALISTLSEIDQVDQAGAPKTNGRTARSSKGRSSRSTP
ncbi:MAG TPA: DNA gyrase subunit A [Thermomicrobiales bacterium]|nr:DNA gyrase subunit A [Thermomicrobiales bacterium]